MISLPMPPVLSKLVARGPILAIVLTGCADPPSPSSPADPPSQEISRDTAVAEARNDAARRFQVLTPTSVIAVRSGRYWIVDLIAPGGDRLHYAIAADGMIRERRVVR